MFEKKRVLILIDWFTPGFKGGGPIRSVTNLVRALSNEIEFSIVTRDTDLPDAETPRPLPYADVPSDVWIELPGKAKIIYLSAANLKTGAMRKIVEAQNFDFLYLNSLFSTRFAILPLLTAARQTKRDYEIIVAPRGSLQAGALRQKAAKKTFFLQLFKRLPIARRIIWQATDEQERADLEKHFGARAQIRLAANLPEQHRFEWRETPKTPDAVRFFFASRVSPKKNLEFFLERLRAARGAIVFDVYGALEDINYLEKCKRIVERLPPNVLIEFKGALPPEKLREAVCDYHFSVLTTRGENFGHSIFESLLIGKPVLLSDKTPWRDLAKRHLGWDISLDDFAAFDAAIEQCVRMNQSEYDEWSQAAWKFAREYQNAPELVQQSRELFVRTKR